MAKARTNTRAGGPCRPGGSSLAANPNGYLIYMAGGSQVRNPNFFRPLAVSCWPLAGSSRDPGSGLRTGSVARGGRGIEVVSTGSRCSESLTRVLSGTLTRPSPRDGEGVGGRGHTSGGEDALHSRFEISDKQGCLVARTLSRRPELFHPARLARSFWTCGTSSTGMAIIVTSVLR